MLLLCYGIVTIRPAFCQENHMSGQVTTAEDGSFGGGGGARGSGVTVGQIGKR